MTNWSRIVKPQWNPKVPDRDRLFYALWSTAFFLVLVWGVYWINELYALNWRRFGNHPREWDAWHGIFTFPFLHGDLKHLWNNTAAFTTLNGLLFYFYRSIALKTWWTLFLLSGTGLWICAAGGNHIGASGLIYALASFLFVSGVIRRSALLLRVSLVVAFLYGGMVWWMLPIDQHISWEGHIAGAVSGVITALWLRKQGPLPDSNLFPESFPEEPLPSWWAEAHPDHPDVIAQRIGEDAKKHQDETHGSHHGSIDVEYSVVPRAKPHKKSKRSSDTTD